MKRYLIILALCGAAHAGEEESLAAYGQRMREAEARLQRCVEQAQQRQEELEQRERRREQAELDCAVAMAQARMKVHIARLGAGVESSSSSASPVCVQPYQPRYQSEQESSPDIEEQVEELQEQINAQNSTITISEGVSRDVQVITPGHIIDLRR